jgi:SAM-dependent methyltransferase
VNCPICNASSNAVFVKYGYNVLECEECHHRYCELEPQASHPEEVYNDSYFTGGGAGYTDYLGEASLLIAHGRRYGRLLGQYCSPGVVLDVGAGAGFILKGLTETGWQGDGLEPNAQMAAYARQAYDLNVHVGTFEDFTPDKQYDLITMIQVVAHFYDVQRAFDTASRAVKPGGYWLVETWDKDSKVARTLGENWHEYSPPSVLHWFSRKTLARLASRYGMREVASGRPQKWLNGQHAKSLARYKLKDSPVQFLSPTLAIIPDNLPIPYPSFDLFWMLFQKLD